MARPPKTSDKRRCRQVIFRLTEREYDCLRDKADRAGLPPNELARRLTSKGRRHLVIKTTHHADPALLKRIDKIGHNLNQLVKRAHMFGSIDPEIRGLCKIIKQVVTRTIEEDFDGS